MITEFRKGWLYKNSLGGREVRCLGKTPKGNYVVIHTQSHSHYNQEQENGYIVDKSAVGRYTLVKSCPEDELADQDF